MDIFRTLASRSLSVTAMLSFSGKASTSIHGLGQDDTARVGGGGGVKQTLAMNHSIVDLLLSVS